jgi:hypothetical protein
MPTPSSSARLFSDRGSLFQKNLIQVITLIALFRLWQWKGNSETKTKKGTTMNPLTQFKKKINSATSHRAGACRRGGP